MFTPRILFGTLVVCLISGKLIAGAPALMELQSGKQTWQGKVIAHNDQLCWLMSQDGKLERLEIGKVKTFREVAPQFRSWSSVVLRDQLRREFGKQFEFATSRHYLVCAPNDQRAKKYAEVFEEIYKQFYLYFSVRGFKVIEPEFPLVAIVFPDHGAFAKYAQKDGVRSLTNLKGYYLTTTNRIAAFEDANATGDLYDTLVHEATHQVAFNVGLHTRVGLNPKWVVEGLATVFEAPGIRNSSASASPKSRLNTERLIWFSNFSKSRRKSKSLEAFIAGDEFFDSDQLDAYSQAWALSFFLIETRPREYAKYLASIAARDPLKGYSPEQRLADFKQAFGKDTVMLEAEFLRFIAETR